MRKRVKILLIAEAMLGGIRQHVLDIIYGLDSQKYDIYLAYSSGRADDKFFEEYDKLAKHAHLFCCKYMQRDLSLLKDIKSILELKKIIKKINPDIVHCHSSKAGIVGRIAAKLCGIKKIYYTPNAYSFQNPNLGKIKKKIYITAEKILSRKCTKKTINVSQGEMDCALQYGIDKKNKFVLIYNGVKEVFLPEKEDLRKENGFTKEQILIGVTARLAAQKDPITFLKIAENVLPKNDRVHFIYIGDGDMEHEMREWIENHQLTDRIHMLGFRKDAAILVSMFDIYLSTALYEGLPYSLIEAMRAGVPIIATDVIGNNELVKDGVNGLLFPIKNDEKGTKLVIEQIQRDRINSKQVIQTFENQFTIGIMIKKLNALYQNN